VLTALTAQNTRTVSAVQAIPPEFVRSQLATLFDDVRIDAIKVGMLANADVARTVAECLERCRVSDSVVPVIVDPVMVAKSGDRLLDDGAIDTLRRRVLPLATLITPNLPEAGVLLGRPAPSSLPEMRQAAAALGAMGPRHVLVKGGHLGGADSPDVWFDGQRSVELEAPRVHTRNTHGTGCTLSAAITALLPQRPDLEAALRGAKSYVSDALRASDALGVGSGHGPLHHFHALWR